MAKHIVLKTNMLQKIFFNNSCVPMYLLSLTLARNYPSMTIPFLFKCTYIKYFTVHLDKFLTSKFTIST